MKKILVFFLLMVMCTNASYAHFESVDRSITGILHMDPDDNPIAGQETPFHIDIKDADNKFDIKNCICTITIFDNEEKIYSFENSQLPIGLYEINFNYEIPKKGVYKIVVDGKPKTPDDFKQFNIAFDARFERELDGQERLLNQISSYRGYILFSLVALSFGLVIVLKRIFK